MRIIIERFPVKIFLLFWALVFIAAAISCESRQKREFQLIRIIDKLTEENIVRSPLKNIIEKFNPVEQNLSGKWVFLPDLSSQDQEIWGTSSRHPILGNHLAEFPEGMKLIHDGKEVDYLRSGTNQKTGWRWLGTSETLDLRGFNGYDKTKRGIIINKDNSFQFEKLLPKGNLILDLYMVNPNWQNEQLKVTMTFNGTDTEEMVITRRKYYRIRKKLNFGRYTIEIKLAGTTGQNVTQTPVILGQVKMTGHSDMLLLTHPRQKERSEPQGEYIFHYYTHMALPGKISAVQPDVHYLYNIRNKFPLNDSGIETNPYSIIKKITFDEYALNCLIAPSDSEFHVDLNIPADASFLFEFGYGILNEFKNRESEQPIRFEILLEQAGDENVLFQKTIDWATTKEIINERIDLTPYSGKKVKLSFFTKGPAAEEKTEKEPTVIPFWVNPLIYRVPENDQNNIILISLDTVRPDHLSCYGYQRNTSPSIDRLAADGVLFENAYSTTSWTLPGHVSLLTSLNCLQHQVYFPLQKMTPDTPTLADYLRTQQIYCAAFTGGGYLSETYGFSKGFDSYQEIKLHGDQAIRLDEAERLAELATRWLEDNKDKNFFLFLHTYQPHDPYANIAEVGKEFLDENADWEQVKMESFFGEWGRFNTQISDRVQQNIIDLYDGEIKYTDVKFVQPILEKLKELGLYDSSMIILISDHGEEFFDHEAWLHDHSVYDEGIRIPLIIKFPGGEHKGTRIENIARITDIMPTILERSNIKTNARQFNGVSLDPLIEGKEKKQRTFVSDLALREFTLSPSVISINKDRFKFILNKKISSPYTQRMVRNFDGSQIELYDLENDPGETKNLAANIAYRDICIELLNQINQMYEKADMMKRERDEVTMDQSLRERLKALGYIK